MIRRAVLLAGLALLLFTAPASAAPARVPEQMAALRAAERLFDGSPRRPSREATIVLRDLALALDRLPKEAQERARTLLDRPDDPEGSRGGGVRYTVPSTYFCTAHFCTHYVRSTSDAPPAFDGNANGTPDWVETTASVLEFIWQKEVVEYGFRPPKEDLALTNHGPDARFDVYLADIVDQGILGYCSAERPENYQFWDVPGHCVLDNDYSPAQIGPPGLGGQRELELTAVHEFFHAIQFGYDYGDDVWLLEGTATWIEDAVYDRVNEPYRRFPYSALRQPEVPVDQYSATAPYQYGSWVFWRYLEERLAPNNSHIDPSVIRRVWEWADGRPGAPDYYSLQAAQATLAERGVSFRSGFLGFALANFVPGSFYREGRSWPSAPVARKESLSARRPQARRTLALDHLTSRYVSFVPGAGLGRRSRLTIGLDLPPAVTGSDAAVLVFRRSGARTTRAVRLSFAGDGSVQAPFGRAAVKRVVLVLTNASNRYECGLIGYFFSCRGRPRDDDRRYRYSARVLP